MDFIDIEQAVARANEYTDSVALHGVPVKAPQVNPATKKWQVFNPVSNAYEDTPYNAEGLPPEFRVFGYKMQYKAPSETEWTDLYEIPPVKSYTHTQNVAASVWTIAHNMDNEFVGVRVKDLEGNTLYPGIEYTSKDVVTLRFIFAVQGTAHIS